VGFGLDRLRSSQWPAGNQKWLTRLAVALGLLTLMLGLGLAFGFGQMSRGPLALAFFIPLGLLLIVLKVRQVISISLMTSLLGLLLYLDLASFGLTLLRFVSLEEALAPGQPVAAYLFLADGVEPVHLALYDRYMARAGGYNEAGFSVTIPHFGDKPLETALQGVKPDLKLLGLLNVKYMAAAFPIDQPGLRFDGTVAGTYLYENRAVLPQARVVHQTLLAEPDWLAQLESLPNLADIALIEADPHLSEGTKPASPAWVTHYTPDLIEIETEVTEPGWLVVSELWYPGWEATVNGASQPVEKVNGMFRGLYLSRPGPYSIVMVYQPSTVLWGNRLAGLTAGLLIATSLALRLKPRY
jgi:hypothetical protein